jgi:octaheme c-type cytochrome (tetrathionate reductase family)
MKYLLLVLILASQISFMNAQEDHSQLIEGPFNSPQEVTETCLGCHDGVDTAIMKTRHWNWKGNEYTTSDGSKAWLGKQNLINNFCVAVPSNWPRCTSCHIGYGWKDKSFDFNDGKNIDCLVCHDQTGTYKKTPTGAGMPDPSVDLLKVAQSVGKTKIANCAACHFNGGGGTGVKHGDMDASLLHPKPEIDVHMGQYKFTCATCHAGENHVISGASHGSSVTGSNHIACTDCHSKTVHEKKVINAHIKTVACETCHIPAFAREEPTKIWWDWSTAGQDKKTPKDEYGQETYNKLKGDFAWKKNVIPAYRWYNGKAGYYRMGEKIEPGKTLVFNRLEGSIENVNAKITPFKVMKGKQIYDSEYKYLIIPKLFGEDGYWKTFNWNDASKIGMESVNLAYSGHFGFVNTEMYWTINHMVAPAKDALKCDDCHSANKPTRLDWKALGYTDDPIKTGSRKTE